MLSPVLSAMKTYGTHRRQVAAVPVDFYFNLEPHDMRAPGYRAGRPQEDVYLHLAGREDTRGRFNLTDGGVEGVVHAPKGWFYLEPLRNYLPGAPTGELVAYNHSDIKSGEELRCGESLTQRLQRGLNRIAVQSEAAIPTNYRYIVDVATEADYEYVKALGGSENANREIEGILNQVDGVYQSELSLRLRLVFQNAWVTPCRRRSHLSRATGQKTIGRPNSRLT